MTDNYCWVHVRRQKSFGPTADKLKENSVFTIAERKIIDRLNCVDDIGDEEREDESENYDDDNVSIISSVTDDEGSDQRDNTEIVD